jgi:hypothetical protein
MNQEIEKNEDRGILAKPLLKMRKVKQSGKGGSIT